MSRYEEGKSGKDSLAVLAWVSIVSIGFFGGLSSAQGLENLELWPTALGALLTVCAWIALLSRRASTQIFWAFLSLVLSVAWIVLFAVMRIQ